MGSKFLGHKKYRINSCNFLQRTNKKKSRSTVEPPLKATSPQWPFFLAYSPYIDSSVAKVAVVERFNGNFFFFYFLSLLFSHRPPSTVSRIQILKMPVMTRGANFPHLQPMAELLRNKRGEIGRQHVKAHCTMQLLQSTLISPRPPRPMKAHVR